MPEKGMLLKFSKVNIKGATIELLAAYIIKPFDLKDSLLSKWTIKYDIA